MPEPQASVTTHPGELVAGRWRLMREIGRGTTGRVWQARDEHLDREVAVKVLEFHSGRRDDEMVARFEREIRVTARLSHPGIATVFEAAEDNAGLPCYIMTLARGRTLDQFLTELRQSPDQWRTLPLIDRLTLFLKLLGIMHYAHSQSVVHRDLKPANIVIGDYGELWILDWGLARDLKEEREAERTYEQVFDQHPTPPPEVQVVLPGDKPPTQRAEAATVIMDGVDTTPIAREDAATDRITTPVESRPATSARLRTAGDSQRRGSSSSHGTTSESQRRNPSTESVRRSSMRLSRSTHFGQVLGSPAYMPPEQAHGRSAVVDQRADIYSLGSILVELLTLRTPQEMGDHESLVEFLSRIRKGERKSLKDLWSDAPQQLHVIAEWSLARDPHDRYPDCEVFAQDLRHLLAHLSESFSEAERARLAKEREGAWRPLGRWDFTANPDSGPFTLPSTAWCGETVGHVHHPELGGMLIGGYGLQIYPLGIEVGDDVRLSVELELVKGEEVWLLARGADPRRSYQFRLGAFEGRWVTVQRAGGGQQPLDAELLTMRPMRDGDTTSARMIRRPAHHRLVVECEGQVLRFHVDGQEPLVFRDLDPISIAPGHHLALATFKSQALVRTLGVERRHSPKMVPSYTVGNELLRLGLHRDAEAWYRRFLAEHAESEEAAEASFLRCMSVVRSGDHAAGAEALRAFLSEHLDHPLARDAIFVLARVQSERQGGNLRAALRELLGYQESGDVVRTRFCLWIMPLIAARIAHSGLTSEVEHDLEQLAKLMRGSPDEQALMGTMSRWLSNHLRSWLGHLVDRNDATAIAACRDAMRRARAHGYAITIREPRLLADYARLGRELAATNDPGQTVVVLGRGEDRPTTLFDYVRDSMALIGMGHSALVLESLQGDEELTAVERVLRAGLRRRAGLVEAATEDLEWCFRLTDQLETSRTSLVMLFAARLGCLALGYLPASLVLDGLDTVRDDIMHAPLMALTAWTCENHGDQANARTLYTRLAAEGSGFSLIGRQGLERLG